MPPTITCAIAAPFTHTSASDITLAASDVVGTVNVNIASGTYRMCLAPSGSDFLRVMETAINTALGVALSAITVAVTLSAAGIVTLTFSGNVTNFSAANHVYKPLGLASNNETPVGSRTVTGVLPVWHLATFIERTSADWQQRTAVASAETAGGAGYGVTSGITRWQDEVAFGFIPRDPTFGASLAVSQTPWEPDAAYLTTLGSVAARAYSVSDLLATALGKTCAYAAGNWSTLRTSTTERYHLVTIPGRECGAPRLARLRDGWDAYRRWTTLLIRQSTPTGTRV